MKIIISKTRIEKTGTMHITSGMVGATIDVEFSSDWEGLNKVAVFTNGEISKDVINPTDIITIPWEVLAEPNKTASVGFYGYSLVNGEKVLAIPTIYIDLGRIDKGADPSGDPAAEPTPTVAEQLQAEVNNHEQRITELEAGGGGGGTSDHRQLSHRDAESQHPMSSIEGLPEALAGKGTYSKPGSGIPKSDLASEVQALLDKAGESASAEYVDGEINDVQRQIDAIVSRSDVVDVVGTYAELQAYDTSSLGDNDVVKVLQDSTHENARSYYRWSVSASAWSYIGSEAEGYTKAETDTLLQGYAPKSDVPTDEHINSLIDDKIGDVITRINNI